MASITDPLAGILYPQPAYPYATGYAALADVAARVNAGTWDPNKPTAAPTADQVTQWLKEATGNIDAALATRGYYVPLAPMTSWTPPVGMPTYQGIGVGAWFMLRHIAAAYATHFVEAARHGSHGASEDANAEHWMTIFDDFMTRIESEADNLEAFGVGGPFVPDINPAHAAGSGSMGAMLSQPSQQEGSLFGKYQNLGSGLEYNMPNPPSGPPFSG